MKRLRRWLLRGTIALVLLALVLVLLAPTLLSTGPVRRMIQARLGDELGREVTLAELDAGWTSGVKLSGLRVGNVGPEFGDTALAEVGTIEITDSLTDLVFGDGPSKIVVAGLVVRIEERAGGRTNLDDLLEKLARPAKKPVKPREPRPIAIELRDCSFRLQRLPRRAPERPVDPFAEDPPIRAADEGLFVAAIERLALTLATGPRGTDVTVRGGVRVNDQVAEVDLTLEQRGDDVKGKGTVRGFDLALLAPFVDGRLAGTVDLAIDGDTRTGLTVNAEVKQFTTGGRLPAVKEEWLRLTAKVVREDDIVRVEGLNIASASGTIALEAHGTIPPQPGESFLVRGHAPAAVALVFMPRRPLGGRIAFDVNGTPTADGVSGTGVISIEGLRPGAPQLRDVDPCNAVIRLDGKLEGESAAGSISIVGPKIKVALDGTGAWNGETTLDVKGNATADLLRIHQLLAPFVALPEDAGVTGTWETSQFRVTRTATGDVTARVQGRVRDLVLTGVLDEPIVRDVTEIDIDAALLENGNRLEVERGRIDRLDAHGFLAGLDGDEIKEADFTVKGEIILVPLFARLAGLAGLDELRGVADLDVRATATPKSAKADGTIVLRDLVVAGDFGRIKEREVRLSGHGQRTDGVAAADVRVATDRLAAHVTGTQPLDAHTTDARVVLNVPNVHDLGAIVPGFAWPEGLAAAGPVRLVAAVQRKHRVVNAQTTVSAPSLTVTVDGQDYADKVELSATLRHNGDTLTGALTSLALDGARLDAKCARVAFDGSRWTFGGADVTLPLEKIQAYVPELADLRLAGRAHIQGDVTLDEAWSVAGSVRLAGLALDLNGTRLQKRDVDLTVRAGNAGGVIAFDRFELRGAGATITGAGTLDKLTVRMEGVPSHLREIVPAIENVAGFTLEATVTRDPVLRAVGSFKFERARIDGSLFENVRATLDVKNLDDLDALVRIKVGRARIDDVTVLDATIDARGIGANIPATVRTPRVLVDKQAFEHVTFDGKFNLDKPLTFEGDVTFQKSLLADQRLTNAGVRIRYHPDRTELTDIRSRINDGLLSGSLDIDTSRKGSPAWSARAKIANVGLTARSSRALSFLLPLLRLSKDARETKLTGFLDGEVGLSAIGFSTTELIQTLAGEGAIELKSMEVKGSVLLPLLSLRISKLISGKPYRFSNAKIRFRIVDHIVKPEPIRLKGEPFGISIKGQAHLDGTIDFIVAPDQLPVPLRVKGHMDNPRVRPAPFGRIRNPFKKGG